MANGIYTTLTDVTILPQILAADLPRQNIPIGKTHHALFLLLNARDTLPIREHK